MDDLQHGTAAIEERARYELGMIKDNEVFVQFVSPQEQAKLPPVADTVTSTRGVVSPNAVSVVPEPAAHGRAQTKRLEAVAARHQAAAEKRRDAHAGHAAR